MGAIIRILAILWFSPVLSKTDASKDQDGRIYDCLSGHECQGAIITTHQEGVDYCCEKGHTLILEMDSGTDEENWFEFDEAFWFDILHMFKTQDDGNEKSTDSDKRGSGGRGDKKPGSNFRDDGLTEPGPDGVAIDKAFIVDHGDLGTSGSTDSDVDVPLSVNGSLPDATLPGLKPKAEVESLAEDNHYPTANYDDTRERQRDSSWRKADAESDDGQTAENKMENVVKYKIQASDMDTLLSAFFPRSDLARKLTRRDADVGGERTRDVDVNDGDQDSINVNVVTLRSLSNMAVTPEAWMRRCLCNARGNPQATDLIGVIMDYLKKLWFF
ncbi:unnamed protein product [Lymnaea stagnalis]|uniref:Uncharacterized protein n=1 Tax=Lymnaea stagnalis TaxID=6523 RepID=A0AAV2IGK6_LYMST